MLQQYDAFGSLMPLREAVNRLFEESFVGPRFEVASGKGFPINIYETSDRKQLVVEAALPGMKPEQIHVQVEGEILTIRTDQKQEQKIEKGSFVRQEITRNEMYRALSLSVPIDAERIEATYEHGILTLRIPKAAAALPKQVPIQVKELAKV